jgi:membrane protease YdiL (CAAX protease family)
MKQVNSRSANSIFHIPLTIYLLATFGSAWLIWLPPLIAQYFRLSLPVPTVVFITLGSFTPSIFALFLTWRYAGRIELRRLLGRVLVWRVSPVWYLISIVGPAILMILAMYGHILLGGTLPEYVPFGVRWTFVAINFVLIFIIGGPLGEEFGWRGLVLPALEAKLSPPWDSLMLGIIWTVWHLPLFLISESSQHSLPFWLFALLTMPLCILITWIYHCSRDSLLMVMLFHAAVNTWFGALKISPEATGSMRPLTFVLLLTWVAALLVVAGEIS